MRSPSVVACCFAALITLMGSVVAAEPTLRWSASGSFESFVAADLLGHGAVVVEALHTSDSGASLRAEFNTETLTLEAGRRFARGEVRGGLRGELGAAQVLGDVYIDGALRDDAGIFASYAGAYVEAARWLGSAHTLRLHAQARRWFFGSPRGSLALLPQVGWTSTGTASYAYWRVRHDASFSESHRRFERIRGFGFGGAADAMWRDDTTPWGFASIANLPARVSTKLGLWLRAGAPLRDGLRVQAHGRALWLHGADDLSRPRVGGLSAPFVEPLAGLPWAVSRPDRMAHLDVALAARVRGAHELGVGVQGAVVDDIHAEGPLAGAYLFADGRWGPWQLDVRLGRSLTANPRAPALTAHIGVGWAITRTRR